MHRNEYLLAMETLVEQERILRYVTTFGAAKALVLGNRVASLAPEHDRGITVQITRESDGMVLFAWSMDDKAPRNYGLATGKRNATLASGHASPWTQLELLATGGNLDELWQLTRGRAVGRRLPHTRGRRVDSDALCERSSRWQGPPARDTCA